MYWFWAGDIPCTVNFGFHGFPCYDRGVHVIQWQYSHDYFLLAIMSSGEDDVPTAQFGGGLIVERCG